jgi:hypothetical protein
MTNHFSNNVVTSLLLKYGSEIEKYKGLINIELNKNNQDENILDKIDEYTDKLTQVCAKYHTIMFYYGHLSLSNSNVQHVPNVPNVISPIYQTKNDKNIENDLSSLLM